MRTTYTPNEIRIRNNYCEMDLYNKNGVVVATTIFDLSDIEIVSKHKWGLRVGYAFTTIDKKPIALHRLLAKTQKGMVADHINRKTLDNRRKNLRVVSHSKNLLNNSSLGVSKTPGSSTWRAYIGRNGKQIHLGCFRTKKEAIEARKNAKSKEFNETP